MSEPYSAEKGAGRDCPRCGHIHVANEARAVGRFDPTRPTMYAAASGGPLRAARAEAEADECAWRQSKPSPSPVVRAAVEPPPSPPAVASVADEGEGQASGGEGFPAVLMETAARAKAWRDFLAQVRLSLMVWEIDGEVRAGCEHVLVWLRQCTSELAGLGGSDA